MLVLLFVPVAVLGASIVDTLDQYARHLPAGGALLPPPPEAMRDLPLVGERFYAFWLDASKNIHALLSAHVGQIASVGRWMAGIAAGMALELLQFATAIVVAGVVLAYAQRLARVARRLAERIAGPRGGISSR